MPGPGKMASTVLRRLTKKPVTILYPFERSDPAPGLRGKIKFHHDRCIGCGLCARDCPSRACVMVPGEEGRKKRPEFHMDRCTFCAQCEETCPKDAIEMTQEYAMAHFKRPGPVIR